MRILAVASECFPLVKTGGLADVVGALSPALEELGHEVQILLPGYPQVLEQLAQAGVIDDYAELYGGPARILRGRGANGALDVFAIDAPHLFARAGHPYVTADGSEWWDNGFRFAALAVVARELALGRVADYRPDVVHAHDWQAGLTPAYLVFDGRPRPASVMTIHNLAFQGQMPPEWLPSLGLPAWSFTPDGVEYYGGIGFLKAGVYYADQITTVSPTYAREIQGALWGMGMEGLLASRAGDLAGIVNGLDTSTWNPAADPFVEPGYDVRSLTVRARHKAALRERLGLVGDATRPLLCVITRLTWQKGMDVLMDAAGAMLEAGVELVVLGAGDPGMEARLAETAAAHPGRMACTFGYDERQSHQLLAGADAVLVPSRFEPCGLVQLQGLRYGCVPVAARTGGLLDTVIDIDEHPDDATGFLFQAGDAGALADVAARVVGVFGDLARWQGLQRRGMAQDLGWKRAAMRYVEVYERALGARG